MASELLRGFSFYFCTVKEEVDVIVVGGGAAGCFSAIQAGTHFPGAKIVVLEKSARPLAKVKISGGGRCNVTNAESDPEKLAANYPRGSRFLRKAFHRFSSADMVNWLSDRGIRLREYPDGCLFPVTNDSQTIIDCFLHELNRLHIPIQTSQKVISVTHTGEKWEVATPDTIYVAKSVIITAGGQPKHSGFDFCAHLNLNIIAPLPSLFTFNMPQEPIRELMGIVAENAMVKIAGEKWSTNGPLLITHWGMSGPAVLKCSAFGARILAEKNYDTTVLVNWTGEFGQETIREDIKNQLTSPKKMVNQTMYSIKSRLWNYLMTKAGIHEETRWNELSTKQQNRLIEVLANDTYQMQGKTTFKEEFVTAGGIDLSEIDVQTMQSKKYSGLFFAGEVMDIDGVTGGYNFQAAWTTAFIAGKSVLLNQIEGK